MKKVFLYFVFLALAACLVLGMVGCKKDDDVHIHSTAYCAAEPADCTHGGTIAHWACSGCGKNFADEGASEELQSIATDPLGHDMAFHAAVDADCENGGFVAYWACSRCLKNFADEAGAQEISSITVDSLTHDWSAWKAEDDRTHGRVCERDGCLQTQSEAHILNEDNQCTVCDYEYAVTGTEGLAYTPVEESDEVVGYAVSMGSATAAEIVVPYYYKGKPVTTIANEGFSSSNITKIDLPESVLFIGSKAFNNSKLSGRLDIPDSVTYIGSQAFFGCTNLSEVVLGNGLMQIQTATFSTCSGLETVVIGDGVNNIFGSAFLNCTKLKTVVIGSGITESKAIDSAAFSGCSAVASVYYRGTAEQWAKVGTVDNWSNKTLYTATKYYYSPEQPAETGNYWYFGEDGLPLIWGQ